MCKELQKVELHVPANDRGKICASHLCPEREMFWFIVLCYPLTFLKCGSLDKAPGDDQPWIHE
jgi:hypothetical protein